MEFPNTLNEFVVWLGTPAAAGWVIATLLEQWGFFQALVPNVKRAITLVLTIGLPVLSKVVMDGVAPETLEQIAPWFAIVATGLMTWAGSQAVHAVQKKNADEE